MKKRMLSIAITLALCLSMAPAVFAASMDNFKPVRTYDDNFTDISGWYKTDVISAFRYGLVKGNSDTTYNPGGDITIAETVTLAARIHSIYTTGKDDLTNGTEHWYDTYVNYAVQNGIIKSDEYSYGKKATRSEFAAILASALPASALSKKNTVEDNAIPDVKTTDKNADKIYLLYRAGVLTGNDSKGTFNPAKTISRGEVAAIINRMIAPQNRKKPESFYTEPTPSYTPSDDFPSSNPATYEVSDYIPGDIYDPFG